MNLNDMILLSTDDHLIEPPDTFEGHWPAQYKDQAPKLVLNKDTGLDEWIFQGVSVGTNGLGAVVSWPKQEWGFDPVGYSEMRPGVYNLHEKVRDMNVNGVLAATTFPTFPGFAGTHMANLPDKQLSLMGIQAVNDYILDEIVGSYPGRFMPLCILPYYDIDESVKEIHRIAKKGCVTVSIPETPYGLGMPDYASGYWDPIFKAINEHGIVASLHIAGGFSLLQRPKNARPDDTITLAPLISAITGTDLMLSGVLRRFPDTKIAMSEGGLAWISGWLDRMDRHIINQAWTGLDTLPPGMTPTDVWRKNFLACFITDKTALRLRDRIGVDTISWECDYPHSDSTWPYSPEVLLKELDGAGCTDEEIEKITWQNVARFFNWDPFKHTPREQATVGALRALSKDVDISETSKAEYRRRYEAANASA
ncbi:MAG: amidohydrolase family protein [Actinomycetota bacterium]|nr:amidohydrolase family protein [Actinomycetota bacterium]